MLRFTAVAALLTCTLLPPCSSSLAPGTPAVSPVWHLPARCREGDVNALFQFNGTWHLMQQWHARPATSVGHIVSNDLLNWRRLPDALMSGHSSDQQCFDGSSSLVSLGGILTPMLMIDGGCGEKGPGNMSCMESSGNGSTGGIIAFPADLSDPDLIEWHRTGPTIFAGCNGSSGPSPILYNPVSGMAQLIAIHNDGEALFEAIDTSLTAWKMTDPAFLPMRGGGGGLWHVLPLGVVNPDSGEHSSSATNAISWATHIMQLDGVNGDGGATFALMQVDAATSKVLQMAPTGILDLGPGPKYGQLSNTGGTGRGGKPGDARTLHISWNTAAVWSSPCTSSSMHVGQLTSFRDLRFDERLNRPFGALVETPISEYYGLRGAVVDEVANVPLEPTKAAVSMLTLGKGPVSADIEINITSLHQGVMKIGVACGNVSTIYCGLVLTFDLGASNGPNNTRNITMAVEGRRAIFAMLPGETMLPMRIMTDTGSVEVFTCFGRGVYTGGIKYDVCDRESCLVTATYTAAHASSLSVSATAWTMNPISVIPSPLSRDVLFL